MKLEFRRVYLTKRHPLEISRGVITGSENLFVFVKAEGVTGVGELAAATTEAGETAESGKADLSRLAESGLSGCSIHEIWQRGRDMGVGPRALAALDMALWDHLGKVCGQPLYRVLGLGKPTVATSVTIGIGSPEVVRERVPEILSRTGARSLKIKLGSPKGIDADKANFLAVKEAAAPFGVPMRVDANGGWDLAGALEMNRWLADRDVDYVEQPLPRGAEDQLPELFKKRPLPIFVDESCHFAADVPSLAGKVDGVNLKLMKCGGITEALRIVAAARAHGLQTMIGCMGESHVAISAGASIGALIDYIDLDSHLNLADDPTSGSSLVEGVVIPRDAPGHGAGFNDA